MDLIEKSRSSKDTNSR